MENNSAPDVGLDTAAVDGGVGQNLGQQESWYNFLPEDLQQDPNITKYNSAEEFARGHLSAVSMLGRDKIPMPRSDSEYLDVYRRLGAPETGEGYQFDIREYNIPDSWYNKEEQAADLEEYKGWAAELGLTNQQAVAMYDKLMVRQETELNSYNMSVEQEMAKADSQMKETWGEATETNLTIANRALSKFFGDEVVEAINETSLGRNFAFIQGLYNLGTKALEELGIDKRGLSTRTPEQLTQEIGQLQAHPAYFDRSHPEHRLVNDQVMALLERLG